ncbi:MAG: bacillithiol system redox-active protein YtxJ [Planctomycetota bacterium]|nr:bacillithiol system redox-active protein YtxJ [Planctomycetota bacterium]
MKNRQLRDAVDLEEALAAERCLLFKHSPRCGISVSAYKEVEAFLAGHPEVPARWLDVRPQRAFSDDITERTGVRHASPQVLWIVGGDVVWHGSHFDIDRATLARVTAS